MQITIFCPASLQPDANQLALAIGLDPRTTGSTDERTFDRINAWDEAGNGYAIIGMNARPEWIGKAASESVPEPDWPVDMDAAQRARDALTIYPSLPEELPLGFVAVIGADPMTVAALAGLSLTPPEEAE
jgi:hypothetical protein